MRFLGSLALGLLLVFGLFWLMQHLVRPRGEVPAPQTVVEGVELVEPPPESPELAPDAPLPPLDAPPPPPPPAAALARPDIPALDMPAPAAPPVDAGPITLPAMAGATQGLLGSSLTGTGAFGGLATGGGGGGSGGGGGGGVGKGQGFKGKPLLPLSTARPQMPEWACKQGIRGWVEVVFTVMPNGRVTDVKLVDADPRGVFEAAAIESVTHWIYEAYPKARMVKQRVPMNPEDCAYNYQQ